MASSIGHVGWELDKDQVIELLKEHLPQDLQESFIDNIKKRITVSQKYCADNVQYGDFHRIMANQTDMKNFYNKNLNVDKKAYIKMIKYYSNKNSHMVTFEGFVDGSRLHICVTSSDNPMTTKAFMNSNDAKIVRISTDVAISVHVYKEEHHGDQRVLKAKRRNKGH